MAGKENPSSRKSLIAPPGATTRSRAALSASATNHSVTAAHTKSIAKATSSILSPPPPKHTSSPSNWLSESNVSVADELAGVTAEPFSLHAALNEAPSSPFKTSASSFAEIMSNKAPIVRETKMSLTPAMECRSALTVAPTRPVSKAPAKAAPVLPVAPIAPRPRASAVPVPAVSLVPAPKQSAARRKADEVAVAAEAKRAKKEVEDKERSRREEDMAREREWRAQVAKEKEREAALQKERREQEAVLSAKREAEERREWERAEKATALDAALVTRKEKSPSVASTPVKTNSVAATPTRRAAHVAAHVEPVHNPGESNSLFLEKLQRALESGDTGGIGQDARRIQRAVGPVVRSPVKTAGKKQDQPVVQEMSAEDEEVMLLV